MVPVWQYVKDKERLDYITFIYIYLLIIHMSVNMVMWHTGHFPYNV
jgi:hypothetical protein